MALALLTACASPEKTAVFVTKTSTAIADVDGSPASISIGYDRFEGYAGPRFSDGSAYPVASAIETNGEIANRKVRQIFVGGDAALIATGVPASPASAASASADPPRAMFFATGSTTGLKLGFLEGSIVPNSLTIGYRRKEAALVPVDRDKLSTSVLGSLSNDVAVAASPPASAASGSRPNVEFGVEQFFATGDAAKNLAGKTRFKDRFRDAADTAAGNVQRYRDAEVAQARLAMQIILCVDRIPDTQLERVLNNFDDLGIVRDVGAMSQIRKPDTPKARRRLYYDWVTELNPGNPRITTAMEFHRELVCDVMAPQPKP